MTYEKKILGLLKYYWHMYQYIGLKKMFGKTDSGYPRLLALGWCSHREKEVVVCKVGEWKLRLMHEIGNEMVWIILCKRIS